jgi:hypothetical protein
MSYISKCALSWHTHLATPRDCLLGAVWKTKLVQIVARNSRICAKCAKMKCFMIPSLELEALEG